MAKVRSLLPLLALSQLGATSAWSHACRLKAFTTSTLQRISSLPFVVTTSAKSHLLIELGDMPSSTSSEDYEHWPTRQDSPISTTAALCYDNSNGLRSHVYHPANELKAAPSEPLKAPQPIAPIQPQRVQYLSEQPQLAYGYPPQMTYAAPAYYGYPHPQPIAYPAPAYYSHPTTPYTFGAAYDHIYQPPAAAQQPVAEKPKSLTKTWQGRTKAEVSSDNMLIAAREGAYDARQIEPKNLAADQMVWCVEVDGSQTLR